MKLEGIEPRAAQAKAALNRLHHEVHFGLDEGGSLPKGLAAMDLAEVLAIAVQIGKLIDKHFQDDDSARIAFENNYNFQLGHHEYPR